MNSLKLDNPRLNEMQSFITYLYTIRVQNPNINFDENVVYRELCKAGLKRNQFTPQYELISNEFLFDKWINRFDNFQNKSEKLDVFVDPDWSYFIQFTSKQNYVKMMHLRKQFIKLYIPIDFQHLFEGVNQLFDFIKEQDIKHLSKVSKKIRSDNVIVRLGSDDLEGAKKIIDFVNSNPYFKDGLNKSNPFIPTINGIGFMNETGISYNSEMARLLSKFINIYAQMQVAPTVQNFYSWFKKNNYNQEVNDIFESALGIETKLTKSQKMAIFFDALKETSKKYGINQVEYALTEIIQNNNYSGITNGNGKIKYRDLLVKNVSRDEILSYIKEIMNLTTDIAFKDINEFCHKLFENEGIFELNSACLITLSKYNLEQVSFALRKMIYENNPIGFTRYSNDESDKTNYREIISKYDNTTILSIMKKAMELKGIKYNPNDIEQIISLYCNDVLKSNYTNENKEQKMSM